MIFCNAHLSKYNHNIYFVLEKDLIILKKQKKKHLNSLIKECFVYYEVI